MIMVVSGQGVLNCETTLEHFACKKLTEEGHVQAYQPYKQISAPAAPSMVSLCLAEPEYLNRPKGLHSPVLNELQNGKGGSESS